MRPHLSITFGGGSETSGESTNGLLQGLLPAFASIEEVIGVLTEMSQRRIGA